MKWLIIFSCLFIASCSATLPKVLSGKRIPIYNSSNPIPDNLPYEVIKDVSVSHGHGCGGFGKVGSLKGAHILLQNQATQNKADAVLVTSYVRPHGTGGCHDNRYRAKGHLLTVPVFSYTPPDKLDKQSKVKKLNHTLSVSYDETWSALINAVSSEFFELQNYEKDSGLLTLNFDPDAPADYFDCGQWTKSTTTGKGEFSGPYVSWLKFSEEKKIKKQPSGKFNANMKINLRVQSVSNNQTRISINTLYKIAAVRSNIDFKFKATSQSTQQVAISPPNISSTRVCRSSYKLENELLNTIRKISVK